MSFELKVPNLNFLVIRRYTLEKFVSVSGSFMDGCSCEKADCLNKSFFCCSLNRQSVSGAVLICKLDLDSWGVFLRGWEAWHFEFARCRIALSDRLLS